MVMTELRGAVSTRVSGNIHKQVARQLKIAEYTEKKHITKIYAALSCGDGRPPLIVLDYLLNGVPPPMELPENIPPGKRGRRKKQ